MSGRDFGDLVDVEVVSGTAQDPDGSFRGFVTIRATAADGSFLTGQLDPAMLRKMAANFLAAAEAAVGDAVVMSVLVDRVGLDLHAAGFVVSQMRAARHTIDPDPDDREPGAES